MEAFDCNSDASIKKVFFAPRNDNKEFLDYFCLDLDAKHLSAENLKMDWNGSIHRGKVKNFQRLFCAVAFLTNPRIFVLDYEVPSFDADVSHLRHMTFAEMEDKLFLIGGRFFLKLSKRFKGFRIGIRKYLGQRSSGDRLARSFKIKS